MSNLNETLKGKPRPTDKLEARYIRLFMSITFPVFISSI